MQVVLNTCDNSVYCGLVTHSFCRMKGFLCKKKIGACFFSLLFLSPLALNALLQPWQRSVFLHFWSFFFLMVQTDRGSSSVTSQWGCRRGFYQALIICWSATVQQWQNSFMQNLMQLWATIYISEGKHLHEIIVVEEIISNKTAKAEKIYFSILLICLLKCLSGYDKERTREECWCFILGKKHMHICRLTL